MRNLDTVDGQEATEDNPPNPFYTLVREAGEEGGIACKPEEIVLFCVGRAMDDLHGDQQYVLSGLHNGNNIQTHFYNDGMIGRRGLSGTTNDFNGEWPKGSGHAYFVKVVLMIGAEVRDVEGNIHNTCIGTGTQSTLDDYYRRKTPVNDSHGIGPVILAACAIASMD